MSHTITNPVGQSVTLEVIRDNRPLEVMTDADQADVMYAAATLAYPEDGYDTEADNQSASMFTALCQMVQHYSGTAYGDGGATDQINIQTTLDAIRENVLP